MLLLVTNRLFILFGNSLPDADWAPIDAVMFTKAVVGISAVVVGVLAITTAVDVTSRDNDPGGQASCPAYWAHAGLASSRSTGGTGGSDGTEAWFLDGVWPYPVRSTCVVLMNGDVCAWTPRGARKWYR